MRFVRALMEETMSWLQTAAAVAQICTAVVALTAGFLYYNARYKKRVRLEGFLLWEQNCWRDDGRRSIKYIVAHLGLPEEDILRAAWRSAKVVPSPHLNEETRAVEGIYLKYNRGPRRPPWGTPEFIPGKW
jgi:hypothetical protein